MLRRASRKSLRVVIVFVAPGQGVLVVESVADVSRPAGPKGHAGKRRAAVAASIVTVRHERQFRSRIVRHDCVPQLADVRGVVALLRPHHVVLDDRPFFRRVPAELQTQRRPGVVVHQVVPAIHDVDREVVFVVDHVLGAQAEMIKRNRVGEQQAARIVPVVLRLDDLGAVLSDEFSEVKLQALTHRRHVRKVAFLQILREAEASGVGRIHHVHGVAESERDMIPQPAVRSIGRLIGNQLDHIERERLVRRIERPIACEAASSISRENRIADAGDLRVIEVVGVVAVHEAAEGRRAEERGEGRGRRGWRGARRGFLAASLGQSSGSGRPCRSGRRRAGRGRGGGRHRGRWSARRRTRGRRRGAQSRGRAGLALLRFQLLKLALQVVNLLLQRFDFIVDFRCLGSLRARRRALSAAPNRT